MSCKKHPSPAVNGREHRAERMLRYIWISSAANAVYSESKARSPLAPSFPSSLPLAFPRHSPAGLGGFRGLQELAEAFSTVREMIESFEGSVACSWSRAGESSSSSHRRVRSYRESGHVLSGQISDQGLQFAFVLSCLKCQSVALP